MTQKIVCVYPQIWLRGGGHFLLSYPLEARGLEWIGDWRWCLCGVGHRSNSQTEASSSAGRLWTSQEVGDSRIIFMQFSGCCPKGYVTENIIPQQGSVPSAADETETSLRTLLQAVKWAVSHVSPLLALIGSNTSRSLLFGSACAGLCTQTPAAPPLGTNSDWWRFPGSSRRGWPLIAPPVVCQRAAPLFSRTINDAFIALNMSAPLNASAVPAMSAEGNPALVFGVGLLAELRATWLTDRVSIPSSASLIQLRQPAWQRGDSSVFTVH